ncbi:PR domain zinc finger protein 2 [Brachyhypopomus gauderio]|uniref:PR domain zinc finger protein 2 n=1 Tax=Brachyhypopomus gauderio TaxID=698409 RepID=UPI004042FBC9
MMEHSVEEQNVFTEADLDPDYDPDINPDGDLRTSCLFSCQQCQRRFNSRQSLERHTATSCRTRLFKCRHCRKGFSTQFGRRRHERRHENMKRRTGRFMVKPSRKSEGEIQKVVSSQERHHSSQPVNNSPMPDSEGKGDLDGHRENKASFVCKYCKKAFGTHTSLRRHERRIHERHLLPRGVCQKVTSFEEPRGVLHTSSTASILHEEEGEQEQEYMVDISSNISENLSFYIDGKVISTSAVTNCEVMEVNSGAAALIGLDALIINPGQFTQALKIETNDSSSTSDFPGQPSGRRRTSTPPLLPQIKTELESESILTTSSSSSGTTLIGTVLPQPLESTVLQKEKTIYLSPKLKQLLQKQESSKSTFALITEGQNFGSPLSLALLPATSNRFKRRTTSPPSSLQQSSASGAERTVTQEGFSSASKLPKMEGVQGSPVPSLCTTDEVETVNAARSDDIAGAEQQALPLDCSASGTGGRSCNQQPLDLSSAVGKTDGETLAEGVLDLSTGRKSTESDPAGSSTSQVPIRRAKPNSDMLEKVLLNQYASADVPTAADAGLLGAPIVTDLAVMAVAEPVPAANPEGIMFELSLPSPALHAAPPAVLNHGVLHAASPAQLPTELFTSVPSSIPSHQLNPLCATVQSPISVGPTTTLEVSAANSLAAFNVSLPDWLNSAPGGVTHTLIPTTPSLSLQGSPFLTDQSVCELAQRALVVDSVLSPEAQIFSPSLSVNQSNIASLSFPPNVIVIEYTVALESSEAARVLQANAVHSDQTPHTDLPELHLSPPPQADTVEPSVPDQVRTGSVEPLVEEMALPSAIPAAPLDMPEAAVLLTHSPCSPGTTETKLENADSSACSDHLKTENSDKSARDKPPLPPLSKRFMCNACDEPFQSMKGLSQHIGEHSETWPYKCEFCVQLFESDTGLLEHRSSYHGIGKFYICRICSKEFAFLCNLEQHHRDVHPGQECSHTEVENGKLRPENHNSPVRVDTDCLVSPTKGRNHQSYNSPATAEDVKDSQNTAEELYTTIKIMASEGVKPKGTDVRLGINQHYPSFKPPPFPYHNRTPAATAAATATSFTTHNIPQTFSTAIRCTKCGKSFDNMPELHKHILACANASDKKRYTPKKNPIPLKQFARAQHGVLSPAKGVNSRQNVSYKVGQPKKPGCSDLVAKVRLNAHSKKKSVWVQRGRTMGRKGSQDELEVYVCPYCSREFTYHTSLKKHMAVSCPMKLVCRKPKKRKGSMTLAQENNGGIRTRTADVMLKPRRLNQGQKTLAKAQISVSGSASNESLPLKAHIGKGKITVHSFRPKKSDSLSTSVVHISKKSKPILIEGVQSPLVSNKSPAAHGKLQQPGIRVQGIARETRPRELGLDPQPMAEHQLSLRVRERTGRPVTRSLLLANTTNRKGVAVTPAKHPGQTDRLNTGALPVVVESNE